MVHLHGAWARKAGDCELPFAVTHSGTAKGNSKKTWLSSREMAENCARLAETAPYSLLPRAFCLPPPPPILEAAPP